MKLFQRLGEVCCSGAAQMRELSEPRGATIPLSPKLTDADVADVIEAVRSCLS